MKSISIILSLVLVLLLAGCAKPLPKNTPQPAGPKETTTTTTPTTPSSETSSPAEPSVPQNTDTSEDGKHFAFVKKITVKDGVYYATLNYALLFTGEKAYEEAAKDGVEADNDYYIRNFNKKLRVFPIKSSIKVSIAVQDPTDVRHLSLKDWKKYQSTAPSKFPDSSDDWGMAIITQNSGYHFTIKNHQIVKIVSFWTP